MAWYWWALIILALLAVIAALTYDPHTYRDGGE